MHISGVGDIAQGTDNLGGQAWVDNYCATNPLENIAGAAWKLIRYLKPR
jgi:hypothetical protein